MEGPTVPAPAHLLPILERIGDGATVHLAQLVDTMIREALAAHVPPDAEDIIRDRDRYAGQLRSLSTALIEGWPDAVSREAAEDFPVATAIDLLRAQEADVAGLRPHVPALEAEVSRLRAQLADATREKPGRDDPLPGTDLTVGESLDRVNAEPLTHDLGGVGVVEDTDHDPDDDLDWKTLEAPEVVAAEIPTTAVPIPPAPSYADPSNEEVRAWCLSQVPPVPCNVRGPVQRRARDAYVRAHLPAKEA